MAMPIALLKESILIILYDYMLTSDHEGFWFDIPAIHEALPANASGAFSQRALNGLVGERFVEQGGSDTLRSDLFALTERGIAEAEHILGQRGVEVEEYEPSPEADLLLSKLHDPVMYEAIVKEVKLLSNEIAISNSFDKELDGNGDLFKSEVCAASTLLDSGRVRISRLRALLVPGLRYLAKKFADQSIGQVASKLITLLTGLN